MYHLIGQQPLRMKHLASKKMLLFCTLAYIFVLRIVETDDLLIGYISQWVRMWRRKNSVLFSWATTLAFYLKGEVSFLHLNIFLLFEKCGD